MTLLHNGSDDPTPINSFVFLPPGPGKEQAIIIDLNKSRILSALE